ncbi:MAG: TonB-dependent receptor, partial [Bdellovibrionales bacterium]|nr:TonB-dependent receptor [Bdellovibrionales bacterium]
KTIQFKVGLQSEGNNPSEMYFPEGSSSDWIGQDAGYRKMPESIHQYIESGQKIIEKIPGISQEGLTKEELNKLGQDLKNNYNLQSKSSHQRIPTLQFTYGDSWGFSNYKLGTLQSLQYSNTFDSKTVDEKKYNAQNAEELVLDERSNTNEFENNIKHSFNSDFGIENFSNKVHFNYLHILDTNNKAQVKTYSIIGDSAEERRRTQTEWVERVLERRQLQGEHQIASEKNHFNWKVQNSEAKRTAPDGKDYSYIRRNDVFELNTDATGNRRNFEYLTDQTTEASGELEFKYQNTKTKIGLLSMNRKRKSDTYRFHFKNNNSDITQVDLTQNLDQILESNKKIDGFELISITDAADSYAGNQNLLSKYVWTESTWLEKIQIGVGFREEVNLTKVETFYYFDPNTTQSLSQVESKDILPAASVSYEMTSRWKSRLAYSKTLARPDFRELSTAAFIDPDSGFDTIGNPQLKTTIIENWDHRYEYYWKDDEFVSFGFFYKKFTDPIESEFEPSPNLRKTYANSNQAQNQGLEFESRTNLRYIDRDYRHFYFQANAAIINSKVDLSNDTQGLQTSKERPLQGQSPYTFNAQIIYKNRVNKLSAALVYNQIGKRITEVGTQGRPDAYESDNNQLDFNFNYNVSKNSNLNFKIKNLTDPEYKSTQGDKTIKTYKKGTQLAFSWTYTM